MNDSTPEGQASDFQSIADVADVDVLYDYLVAQGDVEDDR